MFTMFDTVTVAEVPSFANTDRDAVAGYVDGRFNDFTELEHAFPHAHHLSIAVRSGDVADCLDVETGDATPAEAPAWWHLATMHGIWRPCLYANASTMPSVVQELTKAGIHRSSYRLWVAHFTNVPHVEQGADATQWTDHALGRNLDESLCIDTFFAAAKPAGKPHTWAGLQVEYNPHTFQWKVGRIGWDQGFPGRSTTVG